MDLLPAEVVAPQFAVPIVGVILCALLVFAFGFKSPAQPPSFDVAVDDEERRKQPSKKRKAKETQKAKPLLNGHTVPKLATAAPKQKAEKLSSPKSRAKDEDSSVQAEAKVSKKSGQEKRGEKAKQAADRAEKVSPPAAEDDAEGGWVQQLSKKDRKTRRKEEEKTADAASLGTEPKGSKAQDAADAGQASESSPSKRKKKKETKTEAVADAEQKPLTDVVDEDDAIPITDPEENPKDQRNKRKKDAPVLEPEPVKSPKKESVKDAKAAEEEGTESVSKSKAKKKKEKKKAGEEKEVTPTIVVCSFPKPPPPKLEEHLVKIVEPAETVGPAGDSQTEVKEEESSEAVAPSGSNVAFDELADAWQDAKPQKKKKKVRRD